MKSGLFVICFLSIGLALEYEVCKTVTCGVGTNNQCISVYNNNDTAIVTPCDINSTCDDNDQFSTTTGNWTSATCVAAPVQATTPRDCSANGTTLTGKSCCSNSNCISGTCTGSICEGLARGANCTVDEACKPGDYCSLSEQTDITSGGNVTNTTIVSIDKTCSASLSSGDDCTTDNQCPIGYGCNNLTCDKLFSKDLGSSVSNKMFCQSDFSRNGVCDAMDIYSNNVKLATPFRCDIREKCTYNYASDNTTAATDWCQCGGTANATEGFCGSFGYVHGVWDEIFPKLQYTDSDCSGLSAHTDNFTELFNCSSLNSDDRSYYTAMQDQALYWTLYQSGAIDECSTQLGLFPTNVSVTSGPDDGAITLVLGALLLIFS